MSDTAQASDEAADRLVDLIDKLLKAKPAQRSSADAGEAKVESYTLALLDVPVWAVEAALPLWYRGEAHRDGDDMDEFNYNFAPSTHILRRIAMRQTYALGARLHLMGGLLKAIPRPPEPTPAETEAMRERVKTLFAGLSRHLSTRAKALERLDRMKNGRATRTFLEQKRRVVAEAEAMVQAEAKAESAAA